MPLMLRRAATLAALLLAWQILAGGLHVARGLVPSPAAILGRVAADGLGFYGAGALPTLEGALIGWSAGSAIGIGFAIAARALPWLARSLATLALVAFCMPGIAIGPILTVHYSAAASRAVLATLPIVFILMTATTAGFAAAGTASCDVIRSFGGGRRDRLRHVEIPGALPNVLVALQIAVPFAMLGAVLAEFLGADRGLGVILVTSQQRLALDRVWAVTMLLGFVTVAACAALDCATRCLAPWAADVPLDTIARQAGSGRVAAASAIGGFSRVAGQAGVTIVGWWAVLHILGVPRFIGKSPLDVLAYLADAESGPRRCAALLRDTVVTAADAALGLAVGGTLALAVAVSIAVFPPLRRIVVGPALMAQAMPLAAFAPLLVLTFGRGPGMVGATGAMVAFVPLVLAVQGGFARTPAAALDVAHVCGASRLARLALVQVPTAMPVLLGAVRVAVPVTMAGALIAEWLATGRGAGYGMLLAAATSDYGGVWARLASVTGTTLGLYGLVGALERRILAPPQTGAWTRHEPGP